MSTEVAAKPVEAPAAAPVEPVVAKETEAPLAATEAEKPAETTAVTAEKPVEAAALPEGLLAFKTKNPISIKKILGEKKKHFWFQNEKLSASNLTLYFHEHPRHKTIAWSEVTGKGLLFFARSHEGKAAPQGILVLADVKDLTNDGPKGFSFTYYEHKVELKASSTEERDKWVKALEAEIAKGAETEKSVTESQAYIDEFDRITNPDAVTSTAYVERSVAEAEAKKNEPLTEGESSAAEEKEGKRRSSSKRRASYFGFGKKDKAEKKEEKAEKEEEKKEEKALEGTAAAGAVAAVAAEEHKEHKTEEPVAPVAAAPAAAPAAVSPAEEAATEDVPVSKEKKRNSFFGVLPSFLNKKEKSKEVESPKTEEPVVAAAAGDAPVAADKPVEPLAADVAEPVTGPVVSEPVVEPAAEPVVAPVAEPVAAPVAEPVAAPAAEPAAVPEAPAVEKVPGTNAPEAKSESKKTEAAEVAAGVGAAAVGAVALDKNQKKQKKKEEAAEEKASSPPKESFFAKMKKQGKSALAGTKEKKAEKTDKSAVAAPVATAAAATEAAKEEKAPETAPEVASEAAPVAATETAPVAAAEPITEKAEGATDPVVAPAVSTTALTADEPPSTTTPTVVEPAAAGPTDKGKRRTSVFGAFTKREKKAGDVTSDSENEEKSTGSKLGDILRRPSQILKNRKVSPSKSVTSPTTVEESKELPSTKATTEEAPAAAAATEAEKPVAPALTPATEAESNVVNGAISDVVPAAVTVGNPEVKATA